ncbi:hypothetical protein T01_825 [Trichinella spiralis]|uniref:Uncharacterized protein n=1 Tax=Trichinella spiralis TaxID=6334 RepID=A0A0V1ASE6_TRISP|nr:hypothetical protein T01_825 [Trichinella spiralis]
MDHLKVELGQFFQPAGNLSLRLPKVPQPLQGVVIRPGCELPTIQVWPEVVIRLAVASFETALKQILWFRTLREGVRLLGSSLYQLHLIALLIFHFLMVLSAGLVCDSDDAPSMVSFLPTPKTQAMFPDTLSSFCHGVSDQIHLDVCRHELLSLLRLPLWFSSSHFPRRAFDSSLVQQKERNAAQLSLDYQEKSVEAAHVYVHFIPQSSQFQKVAVQVIMEPRQIDCSVF